MSCRQFTPVIWNALIEPPSNALCPPTSLILSATFCSIRTFVISTTTPVLEWLVSCHAEATLVILFFRIQTSRVSVYGAPAFSDADQNTQAYPACACAQQLAKTLPSIRTRTPIFSSSRFFTDQPSPIHPSGLKK